MKKPLLKNEYSMAKALNQEKNQSENYSHALPLKYSIQLRPKTSKPQLMQITKITYKANMNCGQLKEILENLI